MHSPVKLGLIIRKLVLAISILAGAWTILPGQQIIVNSEGDKILMYPDGSWRPIGAQDSILLKQYLQKSESLKTFPGENGATVTKNKAEEQTALIKEAQDLKFRILNQDKRVQNLFRDATNAKFRAGQLLRNAENNKNLIDPDRIESLNAQYELSIKKLQEAKQNHKSIKTLVSKALALANNPAKINKGKLNQLSSKYNIYLAHFEPGGLITANPKQVIKASGPVEANNSSSTANTENPYAQSTNHSRYIATNGNSPYTTKPYDCKVIADTIDIESKRIQSRVPPAVLFTYTDPDLRPFLKDKELITCNAAVSRVGPYAYLTVEFQIASSHSQNNFGSLQSGSLFRLKLLNGDYVSLYNLKPDRGHLDPYSGYTIFTGQYALGKDEIKKLRSGDLDKIRVLWATGFEDYDVYNVDFFKYQLDCLYSD